jgi:hypothetical protein
VHDETKGGVFHGLAIQGRDFTGPAFTTTSPRPASRPRPEEPGADTPLATTHGHQQAGLQEELATVELGEVASIGPLNVYGVLRDRADSFSPPPRDADCSNACGLVRHRTLRYDCDTSMRVCFPWAR